MLPPVLLKMEVPKLGLSNANTTMKDAGKEELPGLKKGGKLEDVVGLSLKRFQDRSLLVFQL